ncbi:hypothetical protein GALMADRAFT_249099 [Galerina marginata CBS 339.88]|uniref:Uncharacterized protein n=1 Tax=Galerina marginata (strain CBS 339.88) TaxID=685588 RepID=A0A067SW84_GALM3|nr:hypothetical protein GALMADRAFT_249099 [Galerina marginata CBS 339.88]
MQHSDIVSKVPSCFDKALEAGDLLFFPSTIEKHVDSGIEYEIRLCPALQHKPPLPTPHFDKGVKGADPGASFQEQKENSDPFTPPYNENLYVGDLKDEESEEGFVVLLNKYSVVPHHFLLVTKEFKSQASPLMPPELVQVYLLLLAARKLGKKLFGFYNCGDISGASQPHKHIQFLPLDDDGPPIEGLARQAQIEFADRPFSLGNLAYANHSYRLPTYLDTYTQDKLEAVLADAFLRLLDLSISTIRHDPEYPSGKPSYNVIMTLEHLHIIPRRQENYMLETGDKLSVNALGYAGMFLVKSEEELEVVKQETISKILRGVGLASIHDIQVEGTAREAPLSGF